MNVKTCLVFALCLACCPSGSEPPDLSKFDDGIHLKLCNQDECKDPSVLVLLRGDDVNHDPFHWFRIEPTEVDGMLAMAPVDYVYPGVGKYNVKCDQIGEDLFGCGAHKITDDFPSLGWFDGFNDGWELKLCSSNRERFSPSDCRDPGIMISLIGNRDYITQPFRYVDINPTEISNWDVMGGLQNEFVTVGKFNVVCDEVRPDIWACGAEKLEEE